MLDIFGYVVIAGSLLYAAWALYAVIRNQVPREPHVIGAGAVEVLVLLLIVASIVASIGSDGPSDTVTYVGYLIVMPFIIPLGLFWALAEKSRWGTAVLVVAALVNPVLVVRLQQIWDGAVQVA